MNLSFTVYGIPAPQGSMKAFMRKGMRFPVVTCDNAKTKPWRQEIARTCHNKALSYPRGVDGQRFPLLPRGTAVRVEATFYFSRPKSVKRTAEKTTKPDVDKLARALFDALTGIAYEDDSQVTQLLAVKAFDDIPRVEVRISEAITPTVRPK